MRFYRVMTVLGMGLFCIASSMWGQNAGTGGHVGVPQGWSDRSLVFSLNGLSRYPNLMDQEPRIRHQVMQRFRELNPQFFLGEGGSPANTAGGRDWNVNFVRGRVADNMYPAKYTYDPGAPPDCTNDFVVFGLNVVGAKGKQANLVAFNNLYSGPGGICGAAPTVLFAYDVSTQSGGKINLSPIISLDGTKIAFVESATGQSIFHVLTWVAGQGGITSAFVPSNMTSLTFSATATSTTSSPWVDYANDVAYAGADGGLMYKINGVFNSTPTLAAAPWPVTVSGGHKLTPPVLDSVLGLLMIGSANGNLYSVDSTTGALNVVVVGAAGKTSPGIIPPPVVDITNGTTFVVDANDGTSAVLVELDTATLAQIAKGRIGIGGANTGKIAVTIPQPAFTNNYYVNPSTGQIRLCGTGAGTTDTTPWQYAFGFLGRTMNTIPAFSQQLLTSTAAVCTNWTEFFNPNIGAGTDFFFFGLTQDCTGAGTSGCVVAATTEGGALITAGVAGGPSGIVIDNYSAAGQASSIYLSSETGSTGYKFTQSGLQ